MPQSAKGSAWSPLVYPIFRALWIASLSSNIGTWMQNVGAAWLMTSLSASPLLVALMQAATSLPVLLLGFPSGAIADIVDRRRLLLITQTGMVIGTIGLSLATVMGWMTPWTLLAFTFALGIGAAITTPVWQAIIPEIVPPEELPAAIALGGISINLARAVGPALAGIIVAAQGPGAVFFLNSLSFLAVIGVLFCWKRSPMTADLPAERFLGALRAGSRYLRHAPILQAVLIRAGVFVSCGSALWALLPIFAREDLGLDALGYGILLGCLGLGAVGGAWFLPQLRRRLSLNRLVGIATVLFAATTFGLTIVKGLPLLGGVMVLAGLAWLALMSSLNVAAQTSVPSWVQARALGLYQVVFQGGMAICSIVWGIVASQVGVSMTLEIAALGLLGGIVLAPRYPLRLGDRSTLSPSMHWAEPAIAIEARPTDGPVLVQLEYRIDPGSAILFTQAMEDLREIRLRDGAIRWGLFQDIADESRYVESFLVESWAEHERQHHRVTHGDLEIERRAKSFHVGEEAPVVTHLLYKKQK